MDMSGMDMSGMKTSSSNSSMSTMATYFTASLPISPLWFASWQPTTAGTTFAACLGLFGLAVLSKLLGVLRHQANMAWSMVQWQELTTVADTFDKAPEVPNNTIQRQIRSNARHVPPWVAEHEIPRGILAGLHAGLEYFLMLAVMSFNVYFFIAIVFGIFAGEVGFGRWIASSHSSAH
ncbi:hypothetical protein CROQUDRAFT_129758 [Cronartium quercuum f. sp. fusiforme G11]|uniref:Copper transport protein n=1 Tax=Cronartium quercuum f. sp. fusiforme G11 TaxID=708437 RepID=A0A9P6NX56_9BASI|nr:hypothetical protein CROQUDRAFT_129758 [Cronartium quercuum f. sp. fusiforme G11]